MKLPLTGVFDKKGFYVKNTNAVEQLAACDSIVFDKTGTLTSTANATIYFTGKLTAEEKIEVASLNCLQKEGVFTPNCPNKGPSGGPVVAAPAGSTVSNSLKTVLF